MKVGITRYPINWRDWRFGFVVRQFNRDVDVSFGPFAVGVWWSRRLG